MVHQRERKEARRQETEFSRPRLMASAGQGRQEKDRRLSEVWGQKVLGFAGFRRPGFTGTRSAGMREKQTTRLPRPIKPGSQ